MEQLKGWIFLLKKVFLLSFQEALMLKKAKVYDRLEPLIAAAHANQLSLAVFKPTKILDFVWESDDREWDQSKVDQMRSNADLRTAGLCSARAKMHRLDAV